MSATNQRERRQMEKEKHFLEACGFDTSNGFWQEDVDEYRTKEPALYDQYVRYS